MGPAASAGSEEGTVCGIETTVAGDTMNVVGGVTGNGATNSGTGGNGVYGTASLTATVHITHPNDHIKLFCSIASNSSSSQGTYAFSAGLLTTKVASIVSSN